ncbi:hypothetical protein PV797_10205 [Clostridiaceae bacterium M8S5]|nr:hypothetical protein PV797_10205 [Clostridiaceae bacterium M8S5]
MPYVHEFGILDIDDYTEEYIPAKYNCITVDGELIDEMKSLYDKLEKLSTYFHTLDRPSKNLAWYGITLIPPTSHKYFLEVIIQENKLYNSKELEKLINKTKEAIKLNKWIIHYGI